MTPVLNIPGYADAVLRERFIRDSAFLGLSETVAGFELRPMTLRDYIVLRMVRSPLLGKETPTPVEIAQFLWAQSTEYSLDDKARLRFLKRCRYFVPPSKPLLHFRKALAKWQARKEQALARAADVLIAARVYVDEASMDAPPHCVGVGFSPEYHSTICFWVSLFNYAYTPDQVLNMPMKVLFQFLQERKIKNKSTTPLFNRISDGARNQWLIEQNRN